RAPREEGRHARRSLRPGGALLQGLAEDAQVARVAQERHAVGVVEDLDAFGGAPGGARLGVHIEAPRRVARAHDVAAVVEGGQGRGLREGRQRKEGQEAGQDGGAHHSPSGGGHCSRVWPATRRPQEWPPMVVPSQYERTSWPATPHETEVTLPSNHVTFSTWQGPTVSSTLPLGSGGAADAAGSRRSRM